MGPKSAANKAKSPPEPPKPDFKPVEIRFIQPDTAVIALESAEPIVQYEALYALNYFAESYDQELVESVTRLINGGEAGVSSGGMVEAAWSLVESTCQEVTASVYRLLANLFDRYGEAVRPILIRPRPLDLDDSGQDDGEDITYDVPNPFAIRAFDHYAAENCGISLQEMASRLLARLTRDQHPICNDLCQFCDVNKCFSRLRSTDPDVQLNTLKIISNIAKSGECVNSVVNVPDFSFVPMLDLMRSDYTQVQYLAVDVVSWFLALPSTEMTLHVIFRAEDGVKKFMEILEIFEWQDMHSKIFAALIKIAKLYPGPTSRGLQQVNGIEALVDYMENIDDDNLIENGLELLLRLAEDPCSTNVVCGEARTRVRDRMRTLLMEGTKEMVDMSCRVLGYVWNDGDPVDAEALDKIVSMASDPEGSWESRAAPLCTLLSAIRNSPSFAAHLVDINQIDSYKRYVNETPRVAPLEYTKIIVLVLTALVLQESTRKKVMNSDLIGTFVRCCQDENNELAILGAEGLRASLEAGRPPHHWLLPLRIVFRLNCPTFLVHRIYAQLTKDPFNRSLEVVDVMANVIIMLLQDTAEARMLSTTLVKKGILDWLITKKLVWTDCPKLKSIADIILEQHLPAKLVYFRQLSMDDLIADGFYMTKERTKYFRLLGEESPDLTVYMINFQDYEGIPSGPMFSRESSKSSVSEGCPDEQVNSGWDKLIVTADSFESGPESPVGVTPSEDNGEASWAAFSSDSEWIHPFLPADPYLPQILTDLRRSLNITKRDTIGVNTNSALDRGRVEEKIAAVTKVVVERMSRGGVSDEGIEPSCCNTASIDLHIAQLRRMLGTNVVPMGYLRVGRQLERSVLFKSLADKIGLLCALKLGDYNSAWVEVPVPLTRTETPKYKYPLNFLKANYIVDLVYEPGRLIRIGSQEASDYCCAPTGLRVKHHYPLLC